MALCSLSTGRSLTSLALASRTNISPAMTNASLFASPTSLPACTAARVGTNPAPPTMAAMTTSASGAVATAFAPSSPQRISAFWFPRRERKRETSCSLAMLTHRGENSRTCSASLSTFLPAANPDTWNSSGKLRTNFRVLTPMEPVEPRIARDFINHGVA